MRQTSIAVVIVGYKDKNLRQMVDDIKSKSRNYVHFNIFDQHAIDHRAEFADIEQYCAYEFKVWDDLGGHCKARGQKIKEMQDMDYICVISPDIRLIDGWDQMLIDFIESKNSNAVVSGAGLMTLERPNIFDLVPRWDYSEGYSLTNFIDRNFIFAKASAWRNVQYPTFLKYAGEQEFLSIAFLSQGLEIYSMPSQNMQDSKERSIEKKYCIWSREHNYNIVAEILRMETLEEFGLNWDGWNAFMNSFNLDPNTIKSLPYQTNDVAYDPTAINIHDVDARRFITGLKAIH